MLTQKIGFIGTGRMGKALIEGILKKKLVPSQNLWVCDKIEGKLSFFTKYGIKTSLRIQPVVKNTEVIFIAVKPQDILQVLEDLKSGIRASQLIVSIVAGITTSYIIKKLGKKIPVIRIMPNIALLVEEGMTGISAGKGVNLEQKRLVRKILGAVGEVIDVPESQQDAVTGLSGSGPAYIYVVIQGLIQGGVKAGLSQEAASKLAIQTALGAAKLAKESKSSLEELREAVASPGGTTIEGLKVLERGRLKDSLAEAVVRASQRARELRKEAN